MRTYTRFVGGVAADHTAIIGHHIGDGVDGAAHDNGYQVEGVSRIGIVIMTEIGSDCLVLGSL